MTDYWNESQRRNYQCQRVESPLDLSGDESDPQWEQIPWSEPFVDITGLDILEPRFRTRFRMAWDEQFLYVLAELEEPHVCATITEKNAVIFEDNDFELFVDPDADGRNYYELEINAFGTVWELSLPKPYADGGEPRSGCNIEGLKRVVRIDGTLTAPSDRDTGWTIELAIPWAGLKESHADGAAPPSAGDVWRMNFSRVQWRYDVVNGLYVRVPPRDNGPPASLNPEEQQHPEDNWVWSPQGVINMHKPERWGEVEFV